MKTLSHAAADDLLFHLREYRALLRLRARAPSAAAKLAAVDKAIARAEKELGYDEPTRPSN